MKNYYSGNIMQIQKKASAVVGKHLSYEIAYSHQKGTSDRERSFFFPELQLNIQIDRICFHNCRKT